MDSFEQSCAEAMDWPTMEQVFRAAQNCRCRLADVTGGARELRMAVLTRDCAITHEGLGTRMA